MGTVRNVTVADPPAQGKWTLTVPEGHTYRILSFAFRLVTSAQAANRRFGYVVDEGTDDTVYMGSISNTNATASETLYVTSYPGSEAVSWTSGMLNLGMPSGLYVPAGHRLRMYTGIVDSMQTLDQVSQIRIRIEDFPFAISGE